MFVCAHEWLRVGAMNWGMPCLGQLHDTTIVKTGLKSGWQKKLRPVGYVGFGTVLHSSTATHSRFLAQPTMAGKPEYERVLMITGGAGFM